MYQQQQFVQPGLIPATFLLFADVAVLKIFSQVKEGTCHKIANNTCSKLAICYRGFTSQSGYWPSGVSPWALACLRTARTSC